MVFAEETTVLCQIQAYGCCQGAWHLLLTTVRNGGHALRLSRHICRNAAIIRFSRQVPTRRACSRHGFFSASLNTNQVAFAMPM